MSLETTIEYNTQAIKDLTGVFAKLAAHFEALTAPPAPVAKQEVKVATPAIPTAEPVAEAAAKSATLDDVRAAVLAVDKKYGRTKANEVLAKFGAVTITTKGDRKGLEENQYAECLVLCEEVLASGE